jgi:cell division protein FtsZ
MFMSAGDLKLDDFPYSNPGYGRKVAVVGVGSAGCRISNQLSKESKLLEHFVYLTCDAHDVANITKGEKIIIDATAGGKSTPYDVRGLAISKIPELRQQIKDSELVFVISGLGGAVGSGLAPLVAREAREKGALTVAIVIMPFSFEKQKHYFAGGALKHLRSLASGVILIDNDELLGNKKIPAIDAFSLLNQKIALALNKFFGSTEKHEFSVGLNNVVNFLKNNSYSVLCVGEDSETFECRKAVINAARHFDKTVAMTEASKSIVHVIGDKSITMNDLVTSIGGLSGILGNGTMQIEFGFSANSEFYPAAFIVASGFSSTKFDFYDPIDRALKNGGFNIDTGFDTALGAQMLLPDIERE